MESIAKLASAGKADGRGSMDYGIAKKRYLGHGKNLVQVTDIVDVMRTMDKKAYAEYQMIGRDDGGLNALKYLTNWHQNAARKNPGMIDAYEKQSEKYVKKNVNGRKLDTTFGAIETGSKSAFLESLKAFQNSNPGFLEAVINRELASEFWKF